MSRGAEVHDLMEALRIRIEKARAAIREREAEEHRMVFGDYWASRQDDPPEWWDEDEDSQVPGVGSKVSPNGL